MSPCSFGLVGYFHFVCSYSNISFKSITFNVLHHLHSKFEIWTAVFIFFYCTYCSPGLSPKNIPPTAPFEKHFVFGDMLCSGMLPVLIFQTNCTLTPKYAFSSPASLMNTMVIVGLISLQFMIEGNIDHHTATAAVPAVVAHLSTVSWLKASIWLCSVHFMHFIHWQLLDTCTGNANLDDYDLTCKLCAKCNLCFAHCPLCTVPRSKPFACKSWNLPESQIPVSNFLKASVASRVDNKDKHQ